MSSLACAPSPLTRRQQREAERQAEIEAVRNAVMSASVEAIAPAEGATAAQVSGTGALAAPPEADSGPAPRTRRELRLSREPETPVFRTRRELRLAYSAVLEAEALLSAAEESDKDSRTTPVPAVAVEPAVTPPAAAPVVPMRRPFSDEPTVALPPIEHITPSPEPAPLTASGTVTPGVIGLPPVRDPLPTSRSERPMAASRRERRSAERTSARPVRSAHSNEISRAALLGALGAVTIAAPMTGFASANAPVGSFGIAVAQTPVSELTASAASTHLLDGSVSSGTSLQADPRAKLVASELASRAQAKTVINSCEPATAVAASGFSELYTRRLDVPLRPMAEGTYRDTSVYGPRWGSFHYGTDMAAPVGTPIYAPVDGEVVHAGAGIEGRSGTLVIIHSVVDGEDTWFWFGHMYADSVKVAEGDTVLAGDIIAGVGNQGRSTGPHLHFEVHPGAWENTIDPLDWLDDHGAAFPGQC